MALWSAADSALSAHCVQVNDCKAGALLANDDSSVHAWDEAVAFYAGSALFDTDVFPSSSGILQYGLADKRCKNFRTCADGFEGRASVNQHIWQLFARGRDAVREAGGLSGADLQAKCAIAEDSMDKIAALSLVPFIQGTLRYLYKTQTYASSKEAGELWAFASPILPFVHKVDPAAAEKLYRRAWALDYSTDSYTDVKEALESTYNSLGAGAGVGLVTCAAVGDMYDDVGQAVVAPGCTRGYRHIAGYEPLTDVSEHAQIDRDLEFIIAGLGGSCGNQCALKDCSQPSNKDTGVGCNYDGGIVRFPRGDTCQWTGVELSASSTCSVLDVANYDHTRDAKAYDVWRNGANSAKTSAMRAISAFASGAATKGSTAAVPYRNNKHISVMNEYWKMKGLNEFTWGCEALHLPPT